MPAFHTSRDFEAELRQLRESSLAMGARCEKSFRCALEAFWSASPAQVAEVKELDRLIDKDQMDLDALVLRILALRQPVAYDLRFLATALKLVTDLERVGDEAVNIAERAEEGSGHARDVAKSDLRTMADLAQQMLRDALDAFVEGDPTRATQVLRGDDAVDALLGKILRDMIELMQRVTEEIPAAIAVIRVAKHIERVADHATNIAEGVIFMVRGEDVRHGSAHGG
jgi:phosphate transport system protein